MRETSPPDLNLEVQANDADRRSRGLAGRDAAGVRRRSAGHLPGLNSTYVMSVPLGGSVRRPLERAQGMRWSPDGKHVVFVRPGGSYGDSLLIADADGQNPREIVKREGARHLHWPRWSADGKFVYFNYGFSTANAEQTEIFRVSAAGGAAPERVVATARRAVFPAPSPDGRGLFYAANPDAVDTNLWWRDLATGRSRRLTFGIGEYTSPSISADGRRLVAMVSDLRQSLQKLPVEPGGAATMTPLTEGYTGDLDPAWSPDGTRLVFSSSRSGNRNIWTVKADLSNPKALTDGPLDRRAPGVFARWNAGRFCLGSRGSTRHLGRQRRRRFASARCIGERVDHGQLVTRRNASGLCGGRRRSAAARDRGGDERQSEPPADQRRRPMRRRGPRWRTSSLT